MKPIKYYAGEILKDVCTLAKGVVSDNIYAEVRPKASTEVIEDMCVVSLPYRFVDHHVIQTSALRFEIIVKNKQGGIVNVEKLQSMLDAVTNLLPIKTSRFFAHSPYLALRGEDKVGFTIWQVQAELEVDTTDRFE